MPYSPLSARAEEKPSQEETPPADLTPSVVKDPSAEEKASPENTPHAEEMTSLGEKPFQEGEPLLVAKELPEGVTPSAKTQPAKETKPYEASYEKPPSRIGWPSYFVDVPYPKGVVLFMVLVSLIYALVTPPLLQRVAGEPTAFVWTTSHLANSYFFIGTICLSKMRFYTVFFRISYGELLSVAATHFIGTNSGANVATLLTFYAAGMFGHAIAEYLQREETEESLNIVLPPLARVRADEEPVIHFLFSYGVMSFAVIVRMIFLVLYPASVSLPIPIKDHVNIPLFVVDELSAEILFLAWPWSFFVGLILQEEVAVSQYTMLFKIPACVVVFYILSCVLAHAVGEVAGVLTWWPVAMAMAALFGYILAMSARYQKISERLFQYGHCDQISTVQKVLDEPNQKVEPNL